MSQFDELYDSLKNFYFEIRTGPPTIFTITLLTRYAMEFVQARDLSGSQKKVLVVSAVKAVITDILNETDLTEDAKQIILAGLDMVPSMIDAAVDFAKSYSKNKNKKIGKFCC